MIITYNSICVVVRSLLRDGINNKLVFNLYFILDDWVENTKILACFVNIYDGTTFIINTIHYRCRA